MPSRCIVSCCYSEGRGQYYAEFADRMEASLDCWAPGIDRIIFRDGWPPGSPSHSEHHYAFKYFAVAEALRRGYRQILWLDAGSQALAPLDAAWVALDREGVLLVAGADTLGHWISDDALAHFGMTRDWAMGVRLSGGCFVGVDLDSPKGAEFFLEWGRLATHTRLFVCTTSREAELKRVMRSVPQSTTPASLDPRVQGHRSDEACFSVMASKMGVQLMPYGEWARMLKTY